MAASSFVKVYFDEEVKAIRDLVEKLSKYDESHEEVARSTASLDGIKLVLIRNLIEAQAVKHLVGKGWSGSVLMMLTKDEDEMDFESAVYEIEASGVADYKVVLEVDPRRGRTSNMVPVPLVSGQSSPGGRRVRQRREGGSSMKQLEEMIVNLNDKIQALEAAQA